MILAWKLQRQTGGSASLTNPSPVSPEAELGAAPAEACLGLATPSTTPH